MAQQTVVQLIDDLDGGEAEETVSFALDGIEYVIDLSRANADKLRGTLADFMTHARKSGGRKLRRASGKPTVKAGDKAQAQAIRDWARSQGRQISDRGRIPQELVVQFQEAHAS
ncbi:Lsr2 family protein [Solihabitans fulvus]|uniref:Lsr2 family protein n=1 Tax=Solihabitans fulvus TaxID=1892852 RepID=A0A5B2X6X7_9PSEU|nr:Lsr2 family protein [Solihabitans fulvus]KAA2258849.1 Lsr2 family protein [Solihabitans fulvus]